MMDLLSAMLRGGGALSLLPRRERRTGRGKGHYRGHHKPAQRKKYMDKSRERYVMRKRAEEAARAGRVVK